MKIETKFGIGDVLYTASASGVDREIIKAIKVVGIEEKIEYGFIGRNDYWFLLAASDYRWFGSEEVFESKEDAERMNHTLAKKVELEKEKDRQKEIIRLEEQLADKKAGRVTDYDEEET